MNEKILVPLDGSATGETALPEIEDLAIKLLPATDVEIILLHVISDLTIDYTTLQVGVHVPHPPDELRQTRDKAQTYLDGIASRLRAKGIKVTTQIVEGYTSDQIIKTAQTLNANLIAMSTHGRSGIGRWALGSITDKVIHESPIPVLTVRARRAPCKK